MGRIIKEAIGSGADKSKAEDSERADSAGSQQEHVREHWDSEDDNAGTSAADGPAGMADDAHSGDASPAVCQAIGANKRLVRKSHVRNTAGWRVTEEGVSITLRRAKPDAARCSCVIPTS